MIGGGMAGILTAWRLQKAGIRAVVLEADQIGGGQTKNTTAKINSQHGLFCHEFIEKKGVETAEKYLQANQHAVEEYKRIIREEDIDCNLTEADAYVYSSDGERLRREADAAQSTGRYRLSCGVHADVRESRAAAYSDEQCRGGV